MSKTDSELTDPYEVFQRAYKLYGRNQIDFGRHINKTQSQVSKYLSRTVAPPSEALLKCLQIIEQRTQLPDSESNSITVLRQKVNRLNGYEHNGIRQALLTMIKAYEQSKGLNL